MSCSSNKGAERQGTGRQAAPAKHIRSGTVVAFLALVALAVAACGGASGTPTPVVLAPGEGGRDADAAALESIQGLAAELAGRLDARPALRQIDVGPSDGLLTFRYVNEAATEEISVIAPAPNAPPEQWSVRRGVPPLIGHDQRALDLSALRIGPGAVGAAALGHWEACELRSLTLSGEERELIWFVFCLLPEGLVSGTVDNATGVFTPSGASPAPLPPTATASAPPTPTSTVTPAATPSATPTPVPPPTATLSPSPTLTPTTPYEPEPTPTATRSPPATATATPAPTATSIPVPTTTETQTPVIFIGDVSFTAEPAISLEEKSQGLGSRDSLPTGTGMVFLYRQPGTYTFWMRGMRFPLDFVWIGPECGVVEVTEHVPEPDPDTPTNRLPLITPSVPALHVLEINAGLVAELGIEVGEQVRLVGREFEGFGCHDAGG